MTSVIDSPRRYLAELSPITQRTASMILDLPQPLGPTIAVILLGNGTVVASTKDLKPTSFIDFSRIKGSGIQKYHESQGGGNFLTFRHKKKELPLPAGENSSTFSPIHLDLMDFYFLA